MGDHRVIAAVSRTLRGLLTDRMKSMENNPPPDVTLQPPDLAENSGTQGAVNLFLFHVNENPQLKNQSFPVPGPRVDVDSPPLSLNLHYLLTVYGKNNQERAQRLLGDAMQVFHTHGEITEALRQTSTSGGRGRGTGGDRSPVLEPELRGEYENIKITIDPLSIDDVSNIWTTFTVPYRLSVAYRVTVVQIETRESRGPVRLVGPRPQAGPRAHVVPATTPKIEEIRIKHREPADADGVGGWIEKGEVAYPYARLGDVLVIRGYNFSGEDVRVLVGDEDLTPVAERESSRIEVEVPDEEALQPGPIGVRVVKDVVERGDSEASTRIRSNEAFFMLVPRVTSLAADLEADPRTLTIQGTRLYRRDEEDMTFIGDESIPASQYTTKSDTTVEMEIPDTLGSGTYPVRVRVGRVESVDDEILEIT